MNRTRRLLLKNTAIAVAAGLGLPAPALADAGSDDCPAVLTHSLRPLAGATPQPLCDRHAGKVLLMVNTASRCGFTHQFEDLEALYQRYRQQGFEVLGFPSGDFRQELEDEADVAEFCELNYGVSFPMYEKIRVKDEAAHPLFRNLANASGGFPQWNFYKYLVDRDGQVVARYSSSAEPLGSELVERIESLL